MAFALRNGVVWFMLTVYPRETVTLTIFGCYIQSVQKHVFVVPSFDESIAMSRCHSGNIVSHTFTKNNVASQNGGGV